MGGSQSVRDLGAIVDSLALRECGTVHGRAQRGAIDQFADDVEEALLRADVVHGDDAGMIQGSSRASFLLEAGTARGVAGQIGWQYFESDITGEPAIAGAVDLSHATKANGREDLIRSQASSGRQRHIDMAILLYRLLSVAFARTTCGTPQRLIPVVESPSNRQPMVTYRTPLRR